MIDNSADKTLLTHELDTYIRRVRGALINSGAPSAVTGAVLDEGVPLPAHVIVMPPLSQLLLIDACIDGYYVQTKRLVADISNRWVLWYNGTILRIVWVTDKHNVAFMYMNYLKAVSLQGIRLFNNYPYADICWPLKADGLPIPKSSTIKEPRQHHVYR